jgi:hypothetical protein
MAFTLILDFIGYISLFIDKIITFRHKTFYNIQVGIGEYIYHLMYPILKFIFTCGGYVVDFLIYIPYFKNLDYLIRTNIWNIIWYLTVSISTKTYPLQLPMDNETIKPIVIVQRRPTYTSYKSIEPNNLPSNYRSIMTDFFSTFLDFLQENYPIEKYYQDSAPTSPSERVKLWPNLFKNKFQIKWHDELQESYLKNELWEKLAVGGPFAIYLEKRDDYYVIDFSNFEKYPTKKDIEKLGGIIYFKVYNSILKLEYIEYLGYKYYKTDPKFKHIEKITYSAALMQREIGKHGLVYHIGGWIFFSLCIENLPNSHPIKKLMIPHINNTLNTSAHTYVTFKTNGFDVNGFSFDEKHMYKYCDECADQFNLKFTSPYEIMERNNINRKDFNYYYADVIDCYWPAIEKYVSSYINLHYKSNEDILKDNLLTHLYNNLDSYYGNFSEVYPLTIEGLIKLFTTYIFNVTVEHEFATSYNLCTALYPSTTKKNIKEPLGRLMSSMHFIFLISAAVNKISEPVFGKSIFNTEEKILYNKWQQDMFKDGSKQDHIPLYTKLLPSSLENSISA